VKRIHADFDCKHDADVKVSLDDNVEIPANVRGVGKCPECMEEEHIMGIPGVSPKAGGEGMVLDNVMMIPI